MEALLGSKIAFVSTEILSSNKTTGWIGSKYARTCEFICYVFRHVDKYIARKKYNDTNTKDYDSKMRKNHLFLRYLDVLSTIKEKRSDS